MSDKVQLIKKEIEREIEKGKVKCQQSQENNDYESFVAWSEHVATCGKLLVFIDSLPVEPTSDDLEKASIEYSCVNPSERNNGMYDQTDIEWAFEAGAEWQRKQMMKDAVNVIFIQDYAYKTPILYGNLKDKMNIVSGQSIKLCQIKEKQL